MSFMNIYIFVLNILKSMKLLQALYTCRHPPQLISSLFILSRETCCPLLAIILPLANFTAIKLVF